jgi:hypothetical protein
MNVDIVDAVLYRQQIKSQFDLHKDEEQFPDIWEEVRAHALLHVASTKDLTPIQIHNLVIRVRDEFSKSVSH